jgi:hypothetical protein
MSDGNAVRNHRVSEKNVAETERGAAHRTAGAYDLVMRRQFRHRAYAVIDESALIDGLNYFIY